MAHGEQDAQVVAGQRTVQDALAIIGRIEEIAMGLWIASTQYLDRGEYLR